MSVVIIDPTKENLAGITSAISAFGWEMQKTAYEKEVNTKFWDLYLSMKRGKRTVRLSLTSNLKKIKIFGRRNDDGFVITNQVVMFDIDQFTSCYSAMDAKHAAMKDGKLGFTFKKQLLIPYLQGLIEQTGLVRKMKISNETKQFELRGVMNFGIGDENVMIRLKSESYASLVDKEFDDYVFEVYSPTMNGDFKLRECVTAFSKLKEVKAIVDLEYSPRITELENKRAEAHKLTAALHKLNEDI